MEFQARNDRYDQMQYRRCGRSGLMLPLLSLGLWHNFGSLNDPAEQEQMLLTAFDHGITYFDLADNYGPPYGEAERTFGRILKKDLLPYRDELIISTKAGYDMWPGPYGDLGSRKHLLAGIDQSLRRMGLEYVDIFYPTARIPIRRWRRRATRSARLSGRARRFTSAFPTTVPPKRSARARFCGRTVRPASSCSRTIPCLTAGSRMDCCGHWRKRGPVRSSSSRWSRDS